MNQENTGTGQFDETNGAIWGLTVTSGGFLLARLWCRSSRLWLDDAILSASWTCLLVSSILYSVAMSYPEFPLTTDSQGRAFFLFHQVSTTFSCVAISWSKVAFATTLARLQAAKNVLATAMIWFVIATVNLVLVLGVLASWFPACGDPSAVLRPPTHTCWSLESLQYMGGTFIVYGGIVDVGLALVPWLIIRKLKLSLREKVGVALAMSLGALTGVVVVLRAVLQFRYMANRYEGMAFLAIFNALEPSVTIIAQAIPPLRVLLRGVKKRWSSPLGFHNDMDTPTSRSELVMPSNREANIPGGGGQRRMNITPDIDELLTTESMKGHEMLRVTVGPGGRVMEVPVE